MAASGCATGKPLQTLEQVVYASSRQRIAGARGVSRGIIWRVLRSRRRLTILTALLITAHALFPLVAAAEPYFNDATANAGLPLVEQVSWGTQISDIDGDGRPDIFVNRHGQVPYLMRGTRGGFTEVAHAWPGMDRHGCAWGEANGDGRPDLMCTQGADRGEGSRPNELWLNTPDGLFNGATEWAVDRPLGRGRSATWIDYDRDGDLDLFLGVAHRAGVGDLMLRNDRGRFTEVSVGVEADRNTQSSTWADWNRDGWPDLLLMLGGEPPVAFVNRVGRFERADIAELRERAWKSSAWGDYDGDGWPDLALVASGEVRILRNVGSRFSIAKRLRLNRGMAAVWVDLNNDGRLDLYVVQEALTHDVGDVGDLADVLLIQQASAGFGAETPPELSGWSGSGDSVSALDHNGDLRMDVLVSNGNLHWIGRTRLLENTFARRNAAAIRLRGPAWNPLGFGARIHLQAARFAYERQVNDGVAWKGQSDPSYVHLGLRTLWAGRVRVTWPDGTRDCVRVTAGSVVDVRIGSSPCG
jgi:hypothetical protein